jgi:hypothetical protein
VTFAAVEGLTQVCVDNGDQCTLLVDRSGGLGSNQRSCSDTCASAGWSCVASGPAGDGALCGTTYSASNCGTGYNYQICICSRF